MNLFNRLTSKTRVALEEVGNYRLEEGKKHIRILVNGVLAGAVPVKRNEQLTGRAEMNIVSQIRRAARGVPSNRRLQTA